MRSLLTFLLFAAALSAQAQYMILDTITVPLVSRPRIGYNPSNDMLTIVYSTNGSNLLIKRTPLNAVRSINGATGTNITLPVGVTTTAALTNDAGFITASGAPVQTVAGKTGTVSLVQADISGLVTALSGKEPTITSGTTAQVLLGNKTLGTLNPALVGLSSVPNTDATQRANHTGNQPVSTVTGAVSAVQGITPTAGSITLPTATTAQQGLISASDMLRLGRAAQTATFTLSSAAHGQTLTHNLGTTNVTFSYKPTGSSTVDTAVGYVTVDANSVTLTTPYNGSSRETATGIVIITAAY